MKHLVVLALLGLAACSRGHVQVTQSSGGAPLPAPRQVLVTDFAVTPGEVKLDRGISAELLRSQSGETPSELEAEAARATQAALGETLAARLGGYGLSVARAPAAMRPAPGTLLVQGQILSVDEGNRTRRTLIGLGAGKSSVEADAQLYYVTDPAQPQFLQSFSGSADSGRMPGAAETLGAGAAAQHLATSAAVTAATHIGGEARKTGDEANADKLADALARQIAQYAVGQGWLPASAVQ